MLVYFQDKNISNKGKMTIKLTILNVFMIFWILFNVVDFVFYLKVEHKIRINFDTKYYPGSGIYIYFKTKKGK